MNLGGAFDARAFSPVSVDGGNEQLPVSEAQGWLVKAIKAEKIAVKDKPNAAFLAVTVQCIEGAANGQKAVWRFNIWSDSQQAVDIALRQLSSFCHCVGVFLLNDTDELLNKPFRVVVEAQSDPKYTQIKGCLTAQGIDPGTGVIRQATAPATQPAPVTLAPQPQPTAAPAFGQAAAPATQPQPAFAPAAAVPASAPWAR